MRCVLPHTQRRHEPKACTSPATALYFFSKRTANSHSDSRRSASERAQAVKGRRGDRRSPIGRRPRSRSFVRSRTRMVAPCCCVCMCVHDVSPTSTVHHSRDRAVICHHTTRACAYHENLAASASCFMSTTSSSQGVQQHCAADGWTCGSEQEGHPRRRSPERHL